MKSFLLAIVVCCTLIEETDAAILPEGSALVNCQVTSVTRKSELVWRWSVRLRIDHVYRGDDELAKEVFEADVWLLGNSGVLKLHPLPKIGERGIWLIRKDGRGRLVADVYGMASLRTGGLPARKLDSDKDGDYARILEWAQSVEQLEAAPADRRNALFTSLATSRNGTISAWAIGSIADVPNAGWRNATLLQIVRDPKVTIQGQIELDRSLCAVLEDEWYQAAARDVMLRRWVEQRQNDLDAQQIFIRLYGTCGRSTPKILKLVQRGVSNEQFSVESRVYGCSLLGKMGRIQHDTTFELLFELPQKQQKTRILRAVASAFALSIHPKGTQIGRLERAAYQIKDEETFDMLREVVKQAWDRFEQKGKAFDRGHISGK